MFPVFMIFYVLVVFFFSSDFLGATILEYDSYGQGAVVNLMRFALSVHRI